MQAAVLFYHLVQLPYNLIVIRIERKQVLTRIVRVNGDGLAFFGIAIDEAFSPLAHVF